MMQQHHLPLPPPIFLRLEELRLFDSSPKLLLLGGCGGRGRPRLPLSVKSVLVGVGGGSVLAGGRGGPSLRGVGGSLRAGGGGGPGRLLGGGPGRLPPPGAGGRGRLEMDPGVVLGGGPLTDDLKRRMQHTLTP
jgi:hypothetical protein